MSVNIVNSCPLTSSNGINASGTQWQELASILSKASGISNKIIFDENGEGACMSPEEASYHVGNGDVVVFWCGWPFYGSGGINQRFSAYLSATGTNLTEAPLNNPFGVSNFSFNPQDYQWNNLVTYPFQRGLITGTDVTSIGGVVASGSAQQNFSVTDFSGNTKQVYIYSCVALPYQGGWFVYAYGDNGSGISAKVLADLIVNITGGTLSSTPTSTSSGSGSSPTYPTYPSGSSSSSSTTPPGTVSGGVYSASPAASSTPPSNNALLLGALGAAALLGVGYFYFGGKPEKEA